MGGTSLLVVFAVLCLTVFALLSLATVQADRRLADSAVQGVADYYAADCKAQETLARLRNGEFPAGVTRHSYEPQAGGVRCSYAVPISEGQELRVEVVLRDGDWTVLRWQAAPVSDGAGARAWISGMAENKNLYSQPRMSAGRGIFPSGKANFRRNTLCIARKFNAVWRKKTRPDGV